MQKIRWEIDAKKFYTIGKYIFFTTGLIGLIRVVDLWSSLEAYNIFSSLAMTLFQFILSAFFSKMQKQEDIKEVNDDEIIKMNEALEKLNLNGGKDAENISKEKRSGKIKNS